MEVGKGIFQRLSGKLSYWKMNVGKNKKLKGSTRDFDVRGSLETIHENFGDAKFLLEAKR